MIYQIDDRYYIKISPRQYVQLDFNIVDDDVILVPTSNKIEINPLNVDIKQIDFQNEKEKIKLMLKKSDDEIRFNKKNNRNKNK